MASVYPNSPILLTWETPENANGDIRKYIVMVKDTKQKKCILWLTIECFDCPNKNTGSAGRSIGNCPDDKSNNVYFKSQKIINVTITNPSIKVYTEYEVTVVALNEYGWGNASSLVSATGQYISEAPRNLTMASVYPNSPILLTWEPPENANGDIRKYIVMVKYIKQKRCILWLTIECSDCPNKNTGSAGRSIGNCPDDKSNHVYFKSQKIINVTITNPSIKVYTEYEVTVVALNEYGWGNASSLISVTGQYKSDQVNNLELKSQFPESRMLVSWTVPTNANGIITQYIISVEEELNNKCIFWRSMTCEDCYAISGMIGSKNISNQCESEKVNNQTFLYKQSTFNVNLSYPEIVPFTHYYVSIWALNGYGWGDERRGFILTGEYVSDPVRDLALSSQFPSSPLMIKWTSPNNTRGLVVQYTVIIEKNDGCLLWWTINCQNCRNNTPGNNTYEYITSSCLRINSTSVFLETETKFSITSKNENLLPYTDYQVTVIPINRFTWGNKSNKTIRTSEYLSSEVEIIKVESSFPRQNLVFWWKIPKNPNGLISHYIILLMSHTTKSCFARVNLTCTDCEAKSYSGEPPFSSCRQISGGGTFSKNDKLLNYTIADPIIQPQVSLNLTIIALNGYGPGEYFSVSTTTSAYIPQNVSTFTFKVSYSKVMVLWSPPSDGITNYTYNLNISRQLSTYTAILPSSNLSWTLDEGHLCTLYQMCIWTSTPYGDGVTSYLNVTTELALLNIPSISLHAVNNTINVNWTFSDPSSCNVNFQVLWSDDSHFGPLETSSNSVTITGLKYYSTYNVTVIPTSIMEGRSRQGSGNSSLIKTEIGNPTIVRDFKCVILTFNSFNCSWTEPLKTNGPIVTYLLECRNDTVIESKIVSSLFATISDGVFPDIEYSCKIQANTSAGPGDFEKTTIYIASSQVPKVIDVSRIPDVMKTSSKGRSTTQIPITLPYSHFTESLGRIVKFTLVLVVNTKGIITKSSKESVDKPYAECDKGNKCPYEIILSFPKSKERIKRSATASKWENEEYQIGAEGDCDASVGAKCNGPLLSNTDYQIGFRAYTRNGYITVGYVVLSTIYDPLAIAIIIPVLILLLMGTLIAIFIIYRRRRSPRFSGTFTTINNTDIVKLNPSPEIHEFEEYYQYISRDSYARANEQFCDIQRISKEQEISNQIRFIEGNETKNRYRNIKPYSHNVIKLNSCEEYINASKICVNHFSGDLDHHCQCTNAYIATQGPLGNNSEKKQQTIGDFWRMAIENDIDIIVNLTKCVESLKEKCFQYWPQKVNVKEMHITGDQSIEVTLQSVESSGIFDERVFLVEMGDQKKTIAQLHFTAWSDHDSPIVHEFLDFYNRFNALRKHESSIMVHCSAGVGRTGTFILIDIELRKIVSQSDRIEIYNTLLNLRRCRCFMVQAEKQYAFVHDVVYEYLKRNNLLSKKVHQHNGSAIESKASFSNPAFE